MDIVTLALSKKYTDQALLGHSGVIKGDKGDQGPKGEDGLTQIYFYPNLSSAVVAANNDTLALGQTGDSVAVTRFGPGNYRIDLLNDVSETVKITISCNLYLSLNGKTLSFTGIGSGLVYDGDISCIIDGKILNSKITKTVEGTTVKADGADNTIKTTAKLLQIIGGEYSQHASDTIYASYTINAHKDSTGIDTTDPYKTLKNKNSLNTLELIDCTVTCSGGSTASTAIMANYSHIECLRSKLEVNNAVFSGGMNAQNCSYVNMVDSIINITEKVKTNNYHMGIRAIKGTCLFTKNCNIMVDTSVASSGTIGIQLAKTTYGHIESTNINVYGRHSVGGARGIELSSTYAFVKDTKIFTDSINADEIVTGVYIGGYGITTEAILVNCDIECNIAPLYCAESGSYYITGCKLTGYQFGIYGSDTLQANVYMKDCILTAGSYSGSYSDQFAPEACISAYNGVFHLDSCTVLAHDALKSVIEIDAVTVNMSNCAITRANTEQSIQLKSTAQLNIGVNNEGIEDLINGQEGNIQYTNDLYRHIDLSTQCTGKDLNVYFSYITNSITSQLASIVDGEES